MARLLVLAYRLRVHLWGAWTLLRWIATATLAASVIILAQWLLRGRPPLPAWHWLVLGLLLAVGVGLPVCGAWAARRGYVIFQPESGLAPPAPRSLAPEDKIQLHAAGRFEVNGKSRLFADLPAYWRTFGSREHAVMAIVQRSRFLLLGHLPDDQVGMWYIFFRPEDILHIVPGRLIFGSQAGPALRVDYRHTPPGKEGKRPPKPIVATAHLRFADEAARSQVWADLVAESDFTLLHLA